MSSTPAHLGELSLTVRCINKNHLTSSMARPGTEALFLIWLGNCTSRELFFVLAHILALEQIKFSQVLL